ncbi:MAG: GNAT family N-acetyltransferase [Pseudomonadota bacterium]
MQIRPYKTEDREAIIRLHGELQDYERAFRTTRAQGRAVSERQVADYEAMMASADEDAHLFIAEDDGTIIGFVFFLAEDEVLEDDPGQVYVQDIAVTSDHRRMGVGAALMGKVRRFMAGRGLGRIDLQVLVGNDEALAFYRALGFETAYLGLKAVLPSPTDD